MELDCRDTLTERILSQRKMLVNKSSSVVKHFITVSKSCERIPDGFLRAGDMVALPESWFSMTLYFSKHSQVNITPSTRGDVLLDDGRIVLTCPENDAATAAFTYTLRDNARHVLRVQNRTGTSYTFLNDAGDCSVVLPHSFMIVQGKTMVASEDILPCLLFSVTTTCDHLLFIDSTNVPEGSAVYVSEGTTVLTFTPLKDDKYTSNVVIQSH